MAELTRADIQGRKTVDAVHVDFADGSSWMYGVEGMPRLQRYSTSGEWFCNKGWLRRFIVKNFGDQS